MSCFTEKKVVRSIHHPTVPFMRSGTGNISPTLLIFKPPIHTMSIFLCLMLISFISISYGIELRQSGSNVQAVRPFTKRQTVGQRTLVFQNVLIRHRFFADTHFSTFTGSQNLDTKPTCKRAKILQTLLRTQLRLFNYLKR